MLNNKNNSRRAATPSEIRAIIDTIEGMLRQPGGWRLDLLNERTSWLAALAIAEGR